jgi:ubiquinone/menaquinone biosynthesis C-methylase UbiE
MFHPNGPTLLELARQALSSTERGYDLLAPKFELTPFCTPDEVIEAVCGRIPSVDSAIDLCCGTGAALPLLSPRCRRLVGVDVSRGMLAEAQRRVSSLPDGSNVDLMRADVLELPFDSEFDVATCFGAFGHILERDQPRFVASLRRALVPGGRFVFVSAAMPAPWTRAYLFSRTFNAIMHVRNALWRPAFVMYYLSFLLPQAAELLQRSGFRVAIEPAELRPPFERLRVVTATRR